MSCQKMLRINSSPVVPGIILHLFSFVLDCANLYGTIIQPINKCTITLTSHVSSAFLLSYGNMV